MVTTLKTAKKSKPLQLGLQVEPWGIIQAVAFLSGERYYFLTGRGGVAMMPAGVVESAHLARPCFMPTKLITLKELKRMYPPRKKK